MIPSRFEYLAPATLDEAVSLLQNHGPEARVLAGGQSLIPLMKFRLASPSYIIDINAIPNLAYVREGNGSLCIGALAREAELEESELVRTRFPILHDTVAVIADPLVRNLATVGGNLAHGDPANDHPATMLALRAEVIATGPSGQRSIAIADFFQDSLATALAQDEILTEIRIPTSRGSSGGAYLKLERKVGDYATAGVAAVLEMQDGICQRAGIGLTNAGATPIPARQAEEFLEGQRVDEEAVREAARLAAGEAHPWDDLRGSEDYKRDMVRVLAVRTLRLALQRAGHGPDTRR
jgi:aerobic carbon-monoxide dehydrogenase medium subunit